jgi:hypothetical protein
MQSGAWSHFWVRIQANVGLTLQDMAPAGKAIIPEPTVLEHLIVAEMWVREN